MVRIALVGVITLVATAGTAVAVESVRVEMAAGVPRLTVDGKPVRGRIFWGRPAGAVVVARARAKPAPNRVAAFDRSRRVFSLASGPPSVFVSQVELAAKAAIDLVSFPVPLPWPPPGTPVDWSAADRACQMVLDANPRALLLPRIGMVPPRWWREAHPDDVMVWDQGPQTHADAVVASPEYRCDAAERLSDLVTHLEL